MSLDMAGTASLLILMVLQVTPVIWRDAALEDWATPLARIGVRPGHYASAEYYAAPADNLRTYPVYPPDKEPAGYWEWLQRQRPQRLVDITQLKSDEDWIRAGERAFRELDIVSTRTNDPAMIARARDPESFRGVFTQRDGSILDPRWVVTDQGVMLTMVDCSGCHMRANFDGSIMFAGPSGAWPENLPTIRPPGLLPRTFIEQMISRFFVGDSIGMALWRMVVTPWLREERVEMLRDLDTYFEFRAAYSPRSAPRNNGSPFYNAKIPDLHTLRYSRYLDATGTHRLRDAEDIARYVALISGADPMEYGHHQVLSPEQRRVPYRYADEVLLAIGKYLLSLEPPKNPNPAFFLQRGLGQRVFYQKGCAGCHVPPNYTSGLLTLAQGYFPETDHPNREDILWTSLGTDPGLAMNTRKGTGLYKIPSLRGVWYRPALLHDGAVTSLEEMFDPRRVDPDYVRNGWTAPGMTPGPVYGHYYGLDLNPRERAALIAFLRNL